MYDNDFIGDQSGLLFFFYGLVFFSIGISILNQPRREKAENPGFWLLGSFGLLHGASEWLVLLQIIEGGVAQWENLRILLLALSFLSLFEFGRRLVANAALHLSSQVAGTIARPQIAYLLPIGSGIMLTLGNSGMAELEAYLRYSFGFTGAALSGAGFLHYATVSQVAVNYKSARRALNMAGFAFLLYAVAAGVVVGPSEFWLSQWINASIFMNVFGFPIELLRTAVGGFLLLGLAGLIQTFNTVASARLQEARGEVDSLRQRSELILDLVDDGVCGIDEFGNISFANAAAKRMLGYEKELLLGLPSYKLRNCGRSGNCARDMDEPDYWPPFPHPEHYRSDREFLRRKDGTCFPVEYTSAPKYEGTQLKGAVLAFRDISARRRHEVAERREQEELFGALFEQAAVGIAVVALDGRCLQVNARLSEMLGFSQATMIESNFADFIHPEERDQCGILRAQLIAASGHASLPLEGRCIRHDNSSIWVQFSFAMVRDCEDKPMYCFLAVEDISERKIAEQMREHYQAKLEQQVEERTQALARSNKELESANRELEAFSYSVSHDLRSPLRSINGFAHALAEDYAHVLDATALTYIERTRNATLRMGDLIDSLLNLSRVSRSELAITTVNLSQLAVELSDQWRQAYPDKQATVHIAQGLVVEGDHTLLRLLLQNLLDNAWKFTAGCKQPAITFGCEEIGGRETYFVRDNGVGFESEYAHKLFLPFERLHEEAQYEGIGIGLATVRRIVQRHHGVAWAEGAVGKGATFYFTLAAEAVDRHERPRAVATG